MKSGPISYWSTSNSQFSGLHRISKRTLWIKIRVSYWMEYTSSSMKSKIREHLNINYELRISNSQLRTGNKFLTMLYSIQHKMRSTSSWSVNFEIVLIEPSVS